MKKFILLCLITANAYSQSVGTKVSFSAVDGKTYSGVVKEIQGNQYKIKYEGFDFEAWLTRDQFQVVSTYQYSASATTATTTNPVSYSQPANDLQGIFDFGKKQGWVTAVQESNYGRYITPLSNENKNRLLTFIQKAKTASARYFVLISWMAKDPPAMLDKFINELNNYTESYQQEKCLMSSHRSVIQQWQNTCAVTTIEVFLADLCPRYAWDLKQTPDFDKIANDPTNENAKEQKTLIERYGAPAAVRGDNSAKVIPINGALDDFVTPLLGVHFSTQQVAEPLPTVLTKIRNQLDRGIDVPLLVGFVGTGARHFVLTMKYKLVQGQYQYLIYDPWDGVCDYVAESTIESGSLSPLLTNWRISIDYYYTAN
jgi:hypothetical protein